MRVRIKQADELPRELTRSAPRQVMLTAGGIGVALAIAALIVGAVIAGVLLYQRISRDIDPVGVADARILQVAPQGERVSVSYSYSVDGREYTGLTRVPKKHRNRFHPHTKASIRYALSEPDRSQLRGYEPQQLPFWLIWAVPAMLLACVVPLLIVIRRQAALLRDGRVTLARITKTHKRNLGDHSAWRVEYEWRALSGALRSGRHDITKNPPPVGAHIPIVYDRENPKRQAPYPFSLVRVVR